MLANGHATDYLFVGNIVYTVSLPIYWIFLKWHVCGFCLSLPSYKVFVIIISNFWSIYYRFLKDYSLEIKRRLPLGRKAVINLDSILKSRDITLPTKVCIVEAMVFQQSCKMWELGHKEYWAPKNLCFWTVVLEKTLESPLNSKDIKPVSAKGNKSWIFIGITDAETEAPILWPLNVKNWLFGKDPDYGKIEGRRRGQQRISW